MSQSRLEIQGVLDVHPFAELVAEITAAELSGSLRLSHRDQKAIVYFKQGQVVFAVSNARWAKLFDLLIRRGKLTGQDLAKIPNFANDLELAGYLQGTGFLTQSDSDGLFADQIQSIIVHLLTWGSGDWSFSSLSRARDGLNFPVSIQRLLADHARCMPIEQMLGRFRSFDETFTRIDVGQNSVELAAEEMAVLNGFDQDDRRTMRSAIDSIGLPESRVMQAIYILWLGGMIRRHDWRPAFSQEAISAMLHAKLERRSEAKYVTPQAAPSDVASPAESVAEAAPPPDDGTISLEEYLDRVEAAQNHYDILGVDPKAEIDELKKAYFALARMFHPDRYHAEGGETLKRVQNAFTELAQAHETLKNPESREVYDYRIRKELADREKSLAGDAGHQSMQLQQAEQHFNKGFALLMEDEIDDATPFLARAAHFAPKNARYRAYYGKALSADDKQRHKAEGEMQAAIKLDPNNPTFRILLAEFFIQVNLLKRAEGELNRLLTIFPSHREAQDLLNNLRVAQKLRT